MLVAAFTPIGFRLFYHFSTCLHLHCIHFHCKEFITALNGVTPVDIVQRSATCSDITFKAVRSRVEILTGVALRGGTHSLFLSCRVEN